MKCLQLAASAAICSLVLAGIQPELARAANAKAAASASSSVGSNISSSVSERRKQKNLAEQERQALRAKLAALKRDIDKTEAAKDNAADVLAAAEDAVSDANASLLDLRDEQTETEQRLKQLSQAQEKLSGIVKAQQERLGKWLREQYIAGNEDRIKLLLSGDNPNRINRDLQYMSYLSQAQAKMLDELRQNLAAVEKNQQEAQEARANLLEIAEDERAQKALLEKEKQRRASAHAQLAKRLASQRSEVGNIERDEQRLSGLLTQLAKMIEEQRRAEAAAAAAAAEKRRLLALEQKRKREEQQRLRDEQRRAALAKASTPSKSKPIKSAPSKVDEIDKDDAPSSALENELVPQANVQASSFASLRGQLRLPLRGAIAIKFGAKRGGGPNSKGLFIRASEGEPVRAIANGKVVFAEWLRGFGNLLIVDHGSQYMSIYGNNQTLLKRAGDAVKSGDSIANAGNSGGNEESGLYFELRHQGRAFDPLGWVNIR